MEIMGIVNVMVATLKINFVDFCHDSAKHASMMALAAPKVGTKIVVKIVQELEK